MLGFRGNLAFLATTSRPIATAVAAKRCPLSSVKGVSTTALCADIRNAAGSSDPSESAPNDAPRMGGGGIACCCGGKNAGGLGGQQRPGGRRWRAGLSLAPSRQDLLRVGRSH